MEEGKKVFCRNDFRCLATNEIYKSVFAENNAGRFKCHLPYLRYTTDVYKVAVVGHHITAGFYNVLKPEPILWMKTKDQQNFYVIAKGYLEPGYYPTAQHLTMSIINLIFQMNATLGDPYEVGVLPLLEVVDTGYVKLIDPSFQENNETWKMALQVSEPLAQLLGCATSGDCKISYNFRHDRLSHIMPGLATPIQAAKMQYPFKYIKLRSNISDEDLLILPMRNITYRATEEANPVYFNLKRLKYREPLEFYFVNDKDEIVEKEGLTALILSFKEKECV